MRTRTDGFTVIELLIYLVVALVVVTAGYKLLISQNRLYMKQRELQDVRGTLKAGGNLLAFELRQAAVGDLYAIDPHGFELRSFSANATICGLHPSLPRFALWGISGHVEAAAESVLAYAANGPDLSDDDWLALPITQTWESGGGVPFCDWKDGHTVSSEAVIEVDDSNVAPAGIVVGAPMRIFRRARYAVFEEDGRWWLGRRVGPQGNPYEILTGPLQNENGLELTYYDENGAETTDPSTVKYVDIRILAESQGRVPRPGEPPGFQEDTVTVRSMLRG